MDLIDFAEQAAGVKLMPYQREVLRMIEQSKGQRVVFIPGRRQGMASMRKVQQELAKIPKPG